MTKKEYNGWFNYETWLFNLWHDDQFTEDAEQAYKDAESCTTFTREENATFALADQIESFCDECYQPEKNGFLSDIQSAAIQEINFHEIAAHYIDDVEKDEEEEAAA